jgi:peptide/nickel transport system substrate-binding protein
VNYERFSSAKAWALTQTLDKTPSTDPKAYQAVMSQLQTLFMQQLPAIPLWYNGMWAMFNTKYWTGWPSASGQKYTPTAWNNYWQMTSIDMLTHLKPAK